MKPERGFIAERPLANHCPELVPAATAQDDPLLALARAGECMAQLLAPGLARLLGGESPEVHANPPRECTLGDLQAEIVALAAISILAAGAQSAPFLVSLDGAAVLRMVDRTFGGKGVAPSPLPDVFPLSAEVLIDRLESLVFASLAAAFGKPDPAGMARLDRVRDFGKLAPFAADGRLCVLDLDIAEPAGQSWRVTLALPSAALAALAGQAGVAEARSRAPNPAEQPFGDVPLTLSAVLVDIPMAVSALSALAPGQVLPVAVARSVPLRIGDRTVAHGTIGALDDRVAIQITQAF